MFVVTFYSLQQRETELAQLRADQGYLKHLAEHDALTGLPNRRALEDLYPKLSRPTGVILFDIDHFKRYNDTHGHLAGDSVLKNFATTLRNMLEWATLSPVGAVRSFSYWHQILNCSPVTN